MGERVRLASLKDGFSFGAWRAPAEDARRGGLVLIHDAFGVTAHVRALADRYGADGYETLAPSLFDRQVPAFEAAPGEPARAHALSEAAPWDEVAADLEAAIDRLAPPVFVVGYGWGGTAAWLAACRCQGLAAACSYYGRRIPELVDETPRCPIILHIGRKDPSFPPATLEAIAARHPDIPIWLYDAGCGFASDRPAEHDPEAARLAGLRTLQLFTLHGGGRGDI